MRKYLFIVLSAFLLTGCTGNLSPQPQPQIPDPFGAPTSTPPATEDAGLESQLKSTNNNLMSDTKVPDSQSQVDLSQQQQTQSDQKPQEPVVPQGALIKTSMGEITVNLFTKKTPKTVANFVGLATGQKPWTHPQTGEKMNTPLYNGTIFHRVISGFMIQGGDPLGNGTGGPGYQFEDEIVDSLKFDKPYLLAMANSGPNTNGSQFFITLDKTPWLNGKHTVFGQVVKGKEVVDKIGQVKTDSNDKPKQDITIEKIQILVNE